MPGKPSKSARKRDQLALQDLGERLVALPADKLDRIPLNDDLRDAVLAATGMSARGALRRQRQLIGKLMRHVDPAPIRAALDAVTRTDRAEKARFKDAERWRDRIGGGGNAELEAFLRHIGRDSDALRDCVDALSRSRTDAERRTARRQLFRAIHAELGADVQNVAP